MRKVYAVVKLPLKEHFGLDDLQVAWPWTIYLVTYMLGQFLAAWLGRRMESRRILAVGMCVAAACNIVLGLLVDSQVASAFLWMCVTMGIFGLAQATGWPHNVALFANWTRRAERGTLFAVWGTCYQFGAIFGKGLAGFLLGWLGLAWSFYGSSLVLLAFTVYFVLRARERPESVGPRRSHDDAEPDAAAPGRDGRADAREPAPLPRAFVVVGRRDGPHLLRLQVPALRARFLVRADPRRALRHVHLGRRLLLHGLRLGRLPRRARRRLLVRPHSGRAPHAGDLLDDLRLPRGRRLRDVDGRADVARCSSSLLLGLIGFMAMGPDSLLSGAAAMDVGNRRQAAVAAGVINGLGSIGPILQEPAIGWLKQNAGPRRRVRAARRASSS